MANNPDGAKRHETDLIEQVGAMEVLALNPDNEASWIDVIHKMDNVYADLVGYQVELEEKNAALEVAQQFISSVLASITDVLIVCDIQGRIQQVNRALEEIVGKRTAALATTIRLTLCSLLATARGSISAKDSLQYHCRLRGEPAGP